MTKKKFSGFEMKLLEKLDEISIQLDILIELLIPSSSVKGLEDFKLGKTQKSVLALCDLKHSQKDMVSKLRRKPSQIRKTLHALRKKGLIKSVKIEKITYYVRVMR